MPRRAPLMEIALGSRLPQEGLYEWLYREFRTAIIERRLAPGGHMPSTRDLARDLGVARGTVVTVFEQLAAEGYVEARQGRSTIVTASLPDDALMVPPPISARRGEGSSSPLLSAQGRLFTAMPSFLPAGVPDTGRPFRPHQPAIDSFPLALWNRINVRVARRMTDRRFLGHGPAFGYRPLREAIAGHLAVTRGVSCDAGRIAIVTGTHQTLDLVARLLLGAGDPVWIEDPAYPGARAVLHGNGATLVPVPVDADGLDVTAGERMSPEAKLAYVTPSHQCPLGVTLSLSRRMALLRWANRVGAWIFEDDYDGEFRYAGRPLVALAGLEPAARVIYAASFSKTLFPALRLGFVVLPECLVEPFERILSLTSWHVPTFGQAVLAEFIADGHYGRHLRQMRTLYAHRRDVLMEAVRRRLDGRVTIPACDAGLEAIGWLPTSADDRDIAQAANARGMELRPLSAYAVNSSLPPALVLGFAAIDDDAIRAGVDSLAEVIKGGRDPRPCRDC